MSSKDNEMEKDFLEALNKNQLKKSKQAAQEGMPYQTLIASALHKFVAGSLMSKG